MASIRDVVQLGAPVLRQQAASIRDFDSQQFKGLIEDMQLTLAESQGVGLAAPQIGESLQVIIVASRPTQRYPKAPLMSPTVMINPQFTPQSDCKVKDWEGCLSIPGIRALVPRYTTIKVEYQDAQGQAECQVLTDFVARVFQHEYDHLEGKVYLDRVEDNRDIIAESEFFKLIS